MNHVSPSASFGVPFWFLVLGAILIVILMVRFFKRLFGVGQKAGYLLSIGTFITAVGAGAWPAYQAEQRGDDWTATIFIAPGLMVLAGMPLVIKLYRAWMGGRVSEKERAAGAAGFRAWLSPLNLVLAIIVAICVEYAYGYSGLAVFAVEIMALLAYPLMMDSRSGAASSASAETADNLTVEREKVLAMLEAGKITAEESAELLSALGSTLREPGRAQTQLLPAQRTMLIGAALVLVGFFMPWFSVNLGEEMQRLSGQIQQQMNQFSQQMPGMPAQSPSNLPNLFDNAPAGTIRVAGGDVPHGLGWIILVASLGAAILPLIAQHLEAESQRTVTMVTLGAGTLLLIYLLTSNPRWISIGLVLATVGYFVQWAAMLKGRRAIAAVAGGVGQHA
jgi:hypothetical protein